MTDKNLVKKLQKAMNDAGHTPKFAESGNYGEMTEAALKLYEFTVTAKKIVAAPLPKPTGEWFGAPWVGANLDMLGLKEGDPKLESRFVPEWKLEGLPGYKTLVGNRHAWCSVVCNADLRKVGIKGTNSAAAASWSKWGKRSPFWFGAHLDIKHKGGGRHCCVFLYWIDEKKKLAATKDGNRSNTYGIFQTDLSGKGDTLATGPRWSNDIPDGQFVSMAEALAKYPELKVGTKGTESSTR